MKRHLLAASILFTVARYGAADAQIIRPDGRSPGHITVSDGKVFGTAISGGANGLGTIWSFHTSTNTFTKLHDFEVPDGGGPNSVAISGTTVFGTARHGGAIGDGTIWSFDTSSETFTKLHDFEDLPDGRYPHGVAVSGTTLFGQAAEGGANEVGTLWSFDTSINSFTKLHDFNLTDIGFYPSGDVAVSDGTVFGTVQLGNRARGDGALWSFDTNTNNLTDLHGFIEETGDIPTGVAISDGKVFGVAGGGAHGDGTLWSFDLGTNTFTNLHDFDEVSDGRFPSGHLAVSETTVIGTANSGGANGDGTLWSFNLVTDTFTNLHDFDQIADGYRPSDGVAVSGPTVFGTARRGGATGDGTLWSFDTSSDTFTNLYNFNVPEPSTATLAAMCSLLLIGYRTRGRRPTNITMGDPSGPITRILDLSRSTSRRLAFANLAWKRR